MLCTDGNHCSPAKALMGIEAREGKQQGKWERGCPPLLVKLLRESYPACPAALVRFLEAVVLQALPWQLKQFLFTPAAITPAPKPCFPLPVTTACVVVHELDWRGHSY